MLDRGRLSYTYVLIGLVVCTTVGFTSVTPGQLGGGVSPSCNAGRASCSSQVLGGCSGYQVSSQFAAATSNQSLPGELLLSIAPNSSVMMCMTYENHSDSHYANVSVGALIGLGELVTLQGGVKEFQITPTAKMQVVANTSSVTLAPDSTLVIGYTVDSGAGAAGVYYLSIPGFCPPLPISVGLSVVNQTAGSFPSLGPVPCPPQGYSYILSLGPEVRVSYIPYAQ